MTELYAPPRPRAAELRDALAAMVNRFGEADYQIAKAIYTPGNPVDSALCRRAKYRYHAVLRLADAHAAAVVREAGS